MFRRGRPNTEPVAHNPQQAAPPTALVPYVFDNRPATRRGKMINNPAVFRVGQRRPVRAGENATGGPANRGGISDYQAGIPFYQTQPSWRFEFEDDYFGPAHRSLTLDVSGVPSNNFRQLGDIHGGRQ